MLRLSLASLFACWGCCYVSFARAEPNVRPALHWSRGAGAEACIDPKSLAQRVGELIGGSLVEPSRANLSIEGHVQPGRRGGFDVRVTALHEGRAISAARLLREPSANCRALDPAIAFVIAVLIDPELLPAQLPEVLVGLSAEGPPAHERLLRELETTPARPAVVPTPAPARAETPAAASGKERSKKKREPTVLELHAGPLLSAGALPKVALGLLTSLAWLPRAWLALQLQERASFMVSRVPLDAFRSSSAQDFTTALLVCPRYAPPGFFVDGCAGPELSVLLARGAGFARNYNGRLLGFAAQLSLAAGFWLNERLQLRAQGFVRVSLLQQRFIQERGDGAHEAFALGRVGGGASLTVGRVF